MATAGSKKSSLWEGVKETVVKAAKTAVGPAEVKAKSADDVAKPDWYGQPASWKKNAADKKKALTESQN
jgi:hypothetical protein